jgi:hypothetical protein
LAPRTSPLASDVHLDQHLAHPGEFGRRFADFPLFSGTTEWL